LHAHLCDYITDTVHNAVESGAGTVELTLSTEGTAVAVVVRDNGVGMTDEEASAAMDPFTTNGAKHARRVGLGLPFLRQIVEATGGDFALSTQPGRGTEVRFSFDGNHVDAPPVGDVPETLCQLLCIDGGHDLRIARRCDGAGYDVGRRDLEEALGELETVRSRLLVRRYLQEREAEISTGDDDQGLPGERHGEVSSTERRRETN
jgi:hypothetical protein